ncbi:MAG TPA: VOC family protein [Acidimicrobiia bacterium]|nr:VOC family protein [Acidimicrobiia bacterium]
MDEIQPVAAARFAQVNLVVSNMERSMDFYRLLGIEVTEMPEPWKAHHQQVTSVAEKVTVEFDSAASVVNWASTWESGRTGVVIGFAVDRDEDVDRVVAAIAGAGYRVLQPPHLAFFGARYAVVEDPDGIPVGIMGPIDDSRRRLPQPPG